MNYFLFFFFVISANLFWLISRERDISKLIYNFIENFGETTIVTGSRRCDDVSLDIYVRGKLYSAHARARKRARTRVHESVANADRDIRWHVRSILANSPSNFHFARVIFVRFTRVYSFSPI